MTAQVKIQKEGGKLISKEKENCDLVLASMGLLHMTFLYPKTDPFIPLSSIDLWLNNSIIRS